MRALFCMSLCCLIACHRSVGIVKPGHYISSGADYRHSLTLTSDSTFVLQMKYQDAFPECRGRWTISALDSLLLACDSVESLSIMLSSGYMRERNIYMRLYSSNTLILREYTFKREK